MSNPVMPLTTENIWNSKTTGIVWSNYTTLPQIPITDDYEADDSGVYVYVGRKKNLVCEAFTISSIVRDRKSGDEYTEISFLDYSEGTAKVVSKQIATAKLFDKDGMSELKGEGFNIASNNYFTTFLAVVKANLNRLIVLGVPSPCKRYFGAIQYGFEINNNEINYNNFIGIDSPPIPSKEYAKYDRQLFKTYGTLEGQKKFMAEFVKDSRFKTFIKQGVASGLTGITREFLTNREDMPRPVYVFAGPKSIGKTYIQKMIIALFGDNRSASPMSHSTGTSPAAARRIKNRLGVVPFIDDDWTEISNSPNGAEELRLKAYEHANGSNNGRANSNGTLREDTSSWEGPLIAFAESNDVVNTLKDGANARVISFDCGARVTSNEMIYGPVEKKLAINKEQDKNYGHIAPLFIESLKGRSEEITEEFTDLTRQYEDELNCSDKVASLYALLQLTYKLAFDAELFPEEWGELTFEDMTKQYDKTNIVNSAEELYEIFKERILSQSNVYIDEQCRLTQGNYEERMEKNMPVRGRIAIKDIDDKRYKIAIVPVDTVNRNIIDIENTYKLPPKKLPVKTWLTEGWLIPNSQGYAQHSCTNITRQYVKGQTKAETCYKIVLEDLTPSEEERKAEAEAQAQKEEQKRNEDKDKLIQFKKKNLEAPEGMMNIPGCIDPEHLYDPDENEFLIQDK